MRIFPICININTYCRYISFSYRTILPIRPLIIAYNNKFSVPISIFIFFIINFNFSTASCNTLICICICICVWIINMFGINRGYRKSNKRSCTHIYVFLA